MSSLRLRLHAGFDRHTGYGNDAVDMALQFSRAGIDVVLDPMSIRPGIERDFTDLLTKDASGPVDIALAFAPPYMIHPDQISYNARMAVGWTMWERTPLTPRDMAECGRPGDWAAPWAREHWWSGPGGLDLMMVTCRDNVEAFRALDSTMHYEICSTGVDAQRFPVVDRDMHRPLRFAVVGVLDGQGRKEPFKVRDAWLRAKQIDPTFDAELLLKTNCPGLHPKMAETYPGLTVITADLPPEQMMAIYANIDVLVSASRGEGVDKPALEAMSTGATVIATNWSGHTNYLHGGVGYPIGGTLEPINPRDLTDPRRDFRVDVEEMAQAMVHAHQHRTEVREKGALAARMVRAEHSWESVINRALRHMTRAMP